MRDEPSAWRRRPPPTGGSGPRYEKVAVTVTGPVNVITLVGPVPADTPFTIQVTVVAPLGRVAFRVTEPVPEIPSEKYPEAVVQIFPQLMPEGVEVIDPDPTFVSVSFAPKFAVTLLA